MGIDVRRAALWCAAGLIVAGVALGGVLAWEIWGTSVETRRHQRELAEEFSRTPVVPLTETEEFLDATEVRSEPGTLVGRIEIPAIGLDAYVVHGTRYRDLVKGPGWVAGTAYPGGPGNSAISGHRTSYGAPFAEIHRLEPGDEVVVTVDGRSHSYFVTGSRIVLPSETDVLRTDDWTRSTLTLISCYPKYSSKKRIIVTAEQRNYVAPGTATAIVSDTGLLRVDDAADFGDSPYDTARSVLEASIWLVGAALVVLVIAARVSERGAIVLPSGPAEPDIFVLGSPIAPAPSPEEPVHH